MRILRSESGKLPIVAIIAVVLVLALGAGAFAFLKASHKGKKAPEKKEPVKLAEWELGEFLVNLADPGEPRYLKANLVLEVAGNEKKGGGHGEGSANPEEAKARDVIISVMSRREMNDLLTDGGKDQLKSELRDELNKVLEGCEVESIYFTSFAMQ